MSQPIVQFLNVTKRFGDFVAVKNLNLDIYPGEFVAVMGPSGCGKTTTLRMLAGLEVPSDGDIFLDGEIMNEVSPHERDTPLVWQSLALFPFLNVRENVEFGLKMRGIQADERRLRAAKWLERMEIKGFSERNVDSLSGGQRQRVALARALVIEPKILLLDEPLSALDAHLVIRMQQVLTRLQRELGITFVYVTHSQSEAFAMADRVVIMGDGEIAQVGRPRDIYREPGNRFVAEFVGRNSIVTGKIESVAQNTAAISTSMGVFTVTVTEDQRIQVGIDATFVIAADLVRLTNTKPEADNVIACSLISEEFVGSVVTLFLESVDGHEFKVQLQERYLAEIDLKSDGSLFLSWPSASAHLLPV